MTKVPALGFEDELLEVDGSAYELLRPHICEVTVLKALFDEDDPEPRKPPQSFSQKTLAHTNQLHPLLLEDPPLELRDPFRPPVSHTFDFLLYHLNLTPPALRHPLLSDSDSGDSLDGLPYSKQLLLCYWLPQF